MVPIALQHVVVKGYSPNYAKRNRMALAFFFILLTVMIMLRHETVGKDTSNYIYYFTNFSRASFGSLWRTSLEIGFAYFNKFVSLVSNDPQMFLAIAAVVVSFLMYPTYKRLCVDATLTIVLFCTMSTFVMMFSGVRQIIAVGIGFIAYEYTRKRKLLLFLVAVIIAVSFHTSALILVVMYPLYHAKITKKWLFIIIPSYLIVLIFNKPIFSVLSFLLEQYTEYDTTIKFTGAYTMLILFVLFAIFTFLIPDERKMDTEIIGIRNLFLFAVIIQMFAPLHTLAMRMNYYFIIFVPLLVPKIIEYRSEKMKQIAIVGRHVMVLFFLVYFFISIGGADNLNVFPYHFYWETV